MVNLGAIEMDSNDKALARRIGNILLIDNEALLLSRIESALIRAKSVTPTALDTPNQRHAAFAVLRAGRLVSVGNWLSHKLQDRLSLLDKQIAKDIKAQAANFNQGALTSLFGDFERDTNAAFDWMQGELSDDLAKLQKILLAHSVEAGSAHYNDAEASTVHPSVSVDDALFLGAPLLEHLDKVKSDLLFRLKAETRKAITAGSSSQETIDRLGLQGEGKVEANLSTRITNLIQAENPLSAINIGIRLFDTTDNSLAKFIQAAVTQLASMTDEDSFDEFDTNEERNMGFVWVSAADANVCPFCEFMDGNQWDENKEPVGDAPDLEIEPPSHFGCRCSLISCDLDADLPQGSFESYLAHFSDAEQKQAFGASSVAAYRKGEITPAALMGQDSNEIPLEKFRVMEPRLELDVDKYGKMGAETGAAANRLTQETRRLANAT